MSLNEVDEDDDFDFNFYSDEDSTIATDNESGVKEDSSVYQDDFNFDFGDDAFISKKSIVDKIVESSGIDSSCRYDEKEDEEFDFNFDEP